MQNKILVLEQEIQRLQNKVAIDKASSRKLAKEIEVHREELSTATLGYTKSREQVTILLKHHTTVHNILEKKNHAIRPLGVDRGITPADFRKAIGIEDVTQIENMAVTDLEGNFRFLKVMGVPDVHADRERGFDLMRYNLTLLLFPHLLPTEKVDSPDSHACKVAHRIKEQKEKNERLAMSVVNVEDGNAEAKDEGEDKIGVVKNGNSPRESMHQVQTLYV
jgi:hypothetical protein